MRRTCFSVLVALTSFCAFAQHAKVGDHVRNVAADDPAMTAAIAKARSTLDEFLAIAKDPPAGASGFKIKVMVTESAGVEHLWFTPFEQRGDAFVGVLANDPQVITSMMAGEVYEVRRDQVTDWGYVLDGKQKGSFTVCALFETMDPATVELYRRDHGFECR